MAALDIHFNISERKILLRVIDLGVVFCALMLVGSYFDFDYFTLSSKNWMWVGVLGLYLMIFGTIFEIYDIQASAMLHRVIPNVAITVSVTVLFYLLTPFLTPLLPSNRLQILYFYFSVLLPMLLWRVFYLTVVTRPRFYRRVLLIGEVDQMEQIVTSFKKADPNYYIIGIINSAGNSGNTSRFGGVSEFAVSELGRLVQEKKVTEIVVSTYNANHITPELYQGLISLMERGVPIKEYSQVFEEMVHRIPVHYVGKDFYRYFPFSRSNQNKFYLFFHRLFDIVVSLLGVLLGILLLPLILIGNLIGNRGALFYKQQRVGQNGVPFQIMKFRTMIKDAEAGGARMASKNDVRITPFGRFLRRSRLDEFPQFFNILKGQMSLIGPRPERPIFVKELSQVIPFYETRHIIKPGLTGWAQVKVRYGETVEDSLLKLQYDLYYIKHRSFFLDANILVKTLSTIVFYRGQ